MASSFFEKAVVEAGGLENTLRREWVFARGSGKARNLISLPTNQEQAILSYIQRTFWPPPKALLTVVCQDRFLGTYSVTELQSVCFVQNRHQHDGSQELFLLCVRDDPWVKHWQITEDYNCKLYLF